MSDHDHSPKTNEMSMKTDQEVATIVDQDELQLVKSLQPRGWDDLTGNELLCNDW